MSDPADEKRPSGLHRLIFRKGLLFRRCCGFPISLARESSVKQKMDKRSNRKWRWKQFKLRSSIFLRKNGLYVALTVCLAVLGAAAAVIFSGGHDEPEEKDVGLSHNQTLNDVTFAPVPNTPAPHKTPNVAARPTIAPPPDFTPAPSATPPADTSVTITPPVNGSVIRVYAMDSLIYSKTLDQWMTHCGVDIAAKQGDEVHAIMEGTVENVYNDDMMGMTVVISHPNGMKSVYSNLKSELSVSEGQKVKNREVIGCIGDTAISECAEQSHLHFELYVNGAPANPEDYITFKKENNA